MWGVFPHPPIRRIAKRIGAAEVTVWRRLRLLREIGFLGDFEVMPNPVLLGVGLCGYKARIEDPRARRKFIEELELVDGVISAVFEFGPRIDLIAVADHPSSRENRERLIKRIDGVESLDRPTPVWLPSCPRTISREKWRLLLAFRRDPSQPISRLATRINASVKTTSARLREMKESGIILGFVIENFAHFPELIVGYALDLKTGTDAREVAQRAGKVQPILLELPITDNPRGGQTTILSFLRPARNANEIEQTAVDLFGLSGVTEGRTFFPGEVRAYRRWIDARLFEVMARRPS